MHLKRRFKEYLFFSVGASLCLAIILIIFQLFCSLFEESKKNIYISQVKFIVEDQKLTNSQILENNLERLNLSSLRDQLFSRSSLHVIEANRQNQEFFVSLKLSSGDKFLSEDILKKLEEGHNFRRIFNGNFFLGDDSVYPEIASIGASIKGTFMALSISLIISVPISILSGIYFEIFAKNNILNRFLNILLINLASIPSIIFGVIGLVICYYLPVARSSALIGGITLSMMMIPIITVSTQQAIKSRSKYIIEAMIALGISRIQILLDYILPCSFIAILKSILLAISRVIGETAPLIIVGMVGFIAESPSNINSPTSSLATIIYSWSEMPDKDFTSKVSSATIFLLLVILTINFIAELFSKKESLDK